MSTPNYKTSRKYKCPYCDFKATRSDLIDHVNKKHESLIPEGYTAARAVYDFINGKDHGTCMICKADVYRWNDKINRYYNLCENPKCKQEVRRIAQERHIRVYNKPHLLDDPEQQEKMLANRRISGTYVFSDGVKHTYTGTYEKNALEFMDKVLGIPGDDIQSPGPVLEYQYNGKTHKWITDIYYIPANLLIEVKDGGSNPNTRSMETYREKQVAKETMVTNLGTFNYIRLTNNDFVQLIDILADMKNEALTNDKPGVKININEEVGGLPPHRPPEAYVVPYGMNNAFSGFAFGTSEDDTILTIGDENNILPMIEGDFEKKYETGPRMIYTGEGISDKIKKFIEVYRSGNPVSELYFVEALIGRKLMCWEEVLVSKCFKLYDKKREEKINKLLENGIVMGRDISESDIVKSVGYVSIHHSPSGFYATTPKPLEMASEIFSSYDDLERSEVIELMNNVFQSHMNKPKNEEGENA